jgi:transposase
MEVSGLVLELDERKIASRGPLEKLENVRHTEAKRVLVFLRKRWVVERTFGWLGRFRRLARDYERLAETLKHFQWLSFLGL